MDIHSRKYRAFRALFGERFEVDDPHRQGDLGCQARCYPFDYAQANRLLWNRGGRCPPALRVPQTDTDHAAWSGPDAIGTEKTWRAPLSVRRAPYVADASPAREKSRRSFHIRNKARL